MLFTPDPTADIKILGISFSEFDELMVGIRFVLSGVNEK